MRSLHVDTYALAQRCAKLDSQGRNSREIAHAIGGIKDSRVRSLLNAIKKLSPKLIERWQLEQPSAFVGNRVCTGDFLANLYPLSHAEQELRLTDKLTEGGAKYPTALKASEALQAALEAVAKLKSESRNDPVQLVQLSGVVDALRFVVGESAEIPGVVLPRTYRSRHR